MFRLLSIMAISIFCCTGTLYAEKGRNLPDDKNMPSLLPGSVGSPAFIRICDSVYERIQLRAYGLEKDVFSKAYKGYQYLKIKGVIRKTNLLTICDYSQSSNNKRLYVIDLNLGKLLFNTYVSHGRNSGEEYAASFSNLNNSNKSSLGFLSTGETYTGKAGYSMRFDGLESGINDQVRNRDIVFHGSQFVNDRVRNTRGVIGKSLGCPAVPLGEHKRIIDVIKGGSCFFINHPDNWYTHTSAILNTNIDLLLNLQVNSISAQPAPSNTVNVPASSDLQTRIIPD